MTWIEALDLVVARTRHGRYRWLCSDANPNTRQRDAYRRAMLRKAGAPEPPPMAAAPRPSPLAASIRAAKLGFRRCLYATSEGCGCSGTHCHHLRRVVGLADCIECLKG